MTIERSNVVTFPVERRVEEWADRMAALIDEGRESEFLGTFVAFATFEDGKNGITWGNIDYDDVASVYVAIGAIEELKYKLIRKLSTKGN